MSGFLVLCGRAPWPHLVPSLSLGGISGGGGWAGAGVSGLSWAPRAGRFIVLHGPALGCSAPAASSLGWMLLHLRVHSRLTLCDECWPGPLPVSGWSMPGAGPALCPARGRGLQGRLPPSCLSLRSPSLSSPSQPRCTATAQLCLLEPLPAPHPWRL